MAMESIGTVKAKEKGSLRLWLVNEALVKLGVGNVEVKGKENIKSLPPDAQVVIMTTHMTDLDVSLAIHALARDLDLVLMDVSTHHKFLGRQGDPGVNVGLHIAGKDHFLPIDYVRGKETTETGEEVDRRFPKPFNTDNFEPAAEALKNGRSVMISAHRGMLKPLQNLEGEDVQKGHGGVYLALLTGAHILPVTVSLDRPAGMSESSWLKALKERPNATVSIGQPFQLEQVPGIEHFAELTKKIKKREKLTPEELAELSRLKAALREKSTEVIKRMSQQLDGQKS